MKILWVATALCCVSLIKADEVVDDDVDAIVITAEDGGARRGRQFAYAVVEPREGATCKTSDGVEGVCSTYSYCYPFYQLSMTTPAWAYGSKDGCSYADANGEATQGHCCVESVQRKAWGPLAYQLLSSPNYWTSRQNPWVLNQFNWGSYPQSTLRWGQRQPSWGAHYPQQQWGQPVQRVPQWPGAGGGAWGQQPQYPGIQQGGAWGQQRPQNPWGQQPAVPQNPWGQQPAVPQNPWGQQPAVPQNPWGQQPQPQYPGAVPGGQYPGQYPQGGGGGFPGAGGQPQPIAPQPVPQQPQPLPQQPQQPIGAGVGGGDADVVGVGAGDGGSPAPAPAPGGDYSQCGVANKQIVYDENGEDQEALDRMAQALQPELKIRGGWSADKNEWPWIVGIYRNNRQFCGGSLIDATHILTAAHCIDHMKSSDIPTLIVKLGDHDINTDSETQTQDIRVAQIIKHKGFSHSTLHNDVAILRLSSPAQYTKNVRPVCLAPQGANVQKDTVATVVGWGLTSETGPRPPVLQEITFKVWDNAECKNVYGSMAPGGITEHMLCAGKKGQDSCMGDSGGPMVRLQGSSYQQIGIVSWGIGCGKAQFPGVYTRVGFMRSWIDKARNKY